MNVSQAIMQRRSIRKFLQKEVPVQQLTELVRLAGLAATGGNKQPLRFGIVSQKPLTGQVFSLLSWAMYLPDFSPAQQEQPAAYLILLSKEPNCAYELGAASTTVMLAAQELGLSTCALAAYDKNKLASLLELPEDLRPELVIAVGYGAQNSRAVPFAGDIRYYQDEAGDFCVPKLALEQTLLFVK